MKEDGPLHAKAANQFNAELIDWDGAQHRSQIDRVARVYAESAIVATDRLHAAIFGMKAGAVPLALIHAGVNKLPSTLEHIMATPHLMQGEAVSVELRDLLVSAQGTISARVAAADERVSSALNSAMESAR